MSGLAPLKGRDASICVALSMPAVLENAVRATFREICRRGQREHRQHQLPPPRPARPLAWGPFAMPLKRSGRILEQARNSSSPSIG